MGIALIALLASLSEAGAETKATAIYQSIGVSPGTPYSRPLGIFYDSIQRECYVADTGNRQIVVCNDKGTPVYRFPHRISKDDDATLGEPTDLVVDRAGRIFVVDGMVDYIDVLDHRGRRIRKIHPPKDACGEGVRFKTLALGPADNVYAALSCDDRRVVVIESALAIGQEIDLDSPVAERGCISGIAVDDSSRIYITDPCATTMVQIYDSSGKYVRGFGQHSAGLENFSFPAGIVVMSNGDIWVLDTIRQIVSCFSAEGEFITYIGGRGSQPGAFDFPSALATDGTRLLFVLERAGSRYQCFRISASE